MILRCLDGAARERIVVSAIERRGKAVQCQVSCAPLSQRPGQIDGAVILIKRGLRPISQSPQISTYCWTRYIA
jgi:hypothetical protein